MCTLTLAWQVFEDTPVAVAANRDESLERESEPPGVYATDPRVVAPRDGSAGGTWVGHNEHGLFVGVTNRWVDGLDGERSRGLLVADCLREPDAESAARHVERAVTDHEYAGFNLVVADGTAALLLEWDGHLRVRTFEPGVHVLVNVGVDGEFFVPPDDDRRADRAHEQADNARRVRAALAPEPGESPAGWLDRARSILADHEYGVCVHRPEEGFGTRSSSLILLGEAGPRYEFADGPPCETAYERVAVDESQV